MNDWKEYIDQKFIPKEEYKFEQEDGEATYGDKIIKVESKIITHKQTKTWFKFQNCYETWELLDHLWFGNPKTKCRPHMYYPIEFDEPTIKEVDDFLKPAFEGWSVKEYYLFNKYSRSLIYRNLKFKGEGKWVWDGNHGCILTLINIFRIIDLLLYSRIIGDVKHIVLEPIKSS